MNIIVDRFEFTANSTISRVSIDGKFICYALEDVDRELEHHTCEYKVAGKTAIPRGVYSVKSTYSNRFKRNMLQIMDVPCFTGIRIHSGNTAEDTEGCLILGKGKELNRVTQSKVAVQEFEAIVEVALANNKIVMLEVK